MADADFGLPRDDERGDISSNSTTTVGDDEEQQEYQDPSKVILKIPSEPPNENTAITYHYLTFETPLPRPANRISKPSTDQIPQPDLKNFMSPFDWPESRKQFMILLSCLATLVAAFTAGSYSPGTEQMRTEWGIGEVAALVGITTFCVGFAVAPMALAPFSEINGRYPVFVGAGILFVVSQLCCAVTRSFGGMLAARFTAGIGSSVFSTMVGGVVSDLYHAEGRNTPMALFSGAALFGTGLGPLCCGFVAQNLNWRWIFWIQTITCGIMVAAVTIFFRETRGSILLSRKAKCLNKWYSELEAAGSYGFEMTISDSDEKPDNRRLEIQRIRWKVASDEERESLAIMIGISVYRPFHLLVTEPVVGFFSLFVAFAWAVLYLTFGSIPLVFRTSYGFDLQQSNTIFASMMIGATIATIYSIYQDRLLARYLASSAKQTTNPSWLRRNIDLSSQEARLYFACIESLFLPIGLFWFGWTQFPSIPWIVPAMSIACATMGIYSIYLATFNYLADVYHRYASSALAAQSFCRNMLGGIIPLVTVQMFNGLTFQGAASLLGGLALVLTAVPWVLVFYGPRIRARSKFASEIM